MVNWKGLGYRVRVLGCGTRGHRTGREEKGFTLLELLIVVAILGLLAAIAIPNMSAFIGTGTVAAANTEARDVETAALAYFADNSDWPNTSGDLSDYLAGDTKATYNFDDDGLISGVSSVEWKNVTWDAGNRIWEKTP